MSNEIAHGSGNANKLDAYVYDFSTKYIYDVGDAAYEDIVAWDDARAEECNISMAAVGDTHFADFPASPRGVYFVLIKIRSGANPAALDLVDGQGVMYWDGAKEITDLSEINSWFKNG